MRLGPCCESRDDYREASVETIERNLFVSFAGALFANVTKVSNEGLAQENRGPACVPQTGDYDAPSRRQRSATAEN